MIRTTCIYVGALMFFIIPSSVFFFHTAYAMTEISSDISEDTVWTADNGPYVITKSVVVKEGVTLTINPGVIIKFKNDTPDNQTYLDVFGKIITNSTEQNKIYITDYADDSVGGDTNQDGSTTPFLHQYGNWVIYFYPESQGSVFNNVTARFAGLIGFIGLNTDISNITISDSWEGLVTGAADDLNGNMNFSNITISKTLNNAFEMDEGTVMIKDSHIDGVEDGDGFALYDGKATVLNSTSTNISHGSGIGIYDSNVSIASSTITSNNTGISFDPFSEGSVHGSTISQNEIYSIDSDSLTPIDARNNYWGNPDGPGETLSGNIVFDPWLTNDPKADIPCCSSVLFIPGIEASRLYTTGVLGESKLWEPSPASLISPLNLDASGNSINSNIYTRDIIDGGPGYSVYKDWSTYMNTLVGNKTIASWQAFPYDWRKDISDIVLGGSIVGDGKGNFDLLNFKQEIQKLASSSLTHKVTLVAHSNGGLVSSYLINYLEKQKEAGLSNSIDSIDKVILVAVPQLGTPEAIPALLHGFDQSLGMSLVMKRETAQSLAQNMMGTYNLLPSEKYFSLSHDPIISFDSSITNTVNALSKDKDISTYAQLQDFLLGTTDMRQNFSSPDALTPVVVNSSLLKKAETNHLLLDDFSYPSTISTYQIVGWGLPTLQKYIYSRATTARNHPVFTALPLMTTQGDGTVLAKSAHAMSTQTLFVDIAAYNKNTHNNKAHANILEIPDVEQSVSNILTGSTTSSNLITSTEPQNSKTLHTRFSVHSPVSIDVYDSEGNHTGIVEASSTDTDVYRVEENIPNSQYYEFGDGKYIDVGDQQSTTLRLQGTGTGTFSLVIEEIQNDVPIKKIEFTDLPVTPLTSATLTFDSNNQNIPELNLDVDGDSYIDFLVGPRAEFDPLLYLQSIRKAVIAFNLKPIAIKELLKKIDKTIDLIQNNKIKQVTNKLQRLLKNIDHQKRLKTVPDTEKQEIVDMLNNLLDNLT